MVTRVCEWCGEEFETHACWVKRGGARYCSRPCHWAAKKGKPSYERTPEHKAAMSDLLKGRPGIPHAIEAAAAARRGVSPSPEHLADMKERWRGEGNPKWSGGVSRARYTQGFFDRDLRAAVIARDKVCVDCGNWDDWPRAMHLHHLDGSTTNHSSGNLVLLCRPCHVLRHTEERRAKQRANEPVA